ncbi:cytochrome P450 [Mycena floridula]|nr:cytochrome P450 [Mycena floridula]
MPPTTEQFKYFMDWRQKWGDLIYLNLMGQPFFIVNSARVMEQLEKRGAEYSERPRLEFGGELCGYSKTIVLMPYGARFRKFRKYIAQVIGSAAAVQKFGDMEEAECRTFLKRMLSEPEFLTTHLRNLSGAIIMKLTYGIDSEAKEQTDFVELIERANDNFSIATTPGSFLVDVFPLLRHAPSWVPFKKLAQKFRAAFDDMVQIPYTHALKLMAEGKAPASFVSSALESEPDYPDKISDISHCAASFYGAGADTTVSAQHAFFLAMILYPEVQKKAQAEIDSVVGPNRLPSLSDAPKLPYLQSLVTEILRWHNVAPLGVPHAASEDGFIDGYFIPKGSLIILNLWGMLHDEAVYPDPFTFDPTRFLESPGKEVQRDPKHACFGACRRVCPGQYLAEKSLWICVAMSLAVFDISNAIEDGVPVIPVHENTPGTISHPKGFKYSVKPRSAQAASLILES